MIFRREYMIVPHCCHRCQRCLAICPAGAIAPSETGEMRIQQTKCRRCGACRKICKFHAVRSRLRLRLF